MFSQIDKSRAHARLHALWHDDSDPRRAAMAQVLTQYADDPAELARMLVLIELLDLACAAPIDIDFYALMESTKLNGEQLELCLIAGGARKRGIRDFTSAEAHEKSTPFELSSDEWRAFYQTVVSV